MYETVTVRELTAPTLRKDEIIRYSGGSSEDEATAQLIDSCVRELLPTLSYKVCYGETAVSVCGDTVSICGCETVSKSLSKYLADCERAIVFGATVGLSPDRLIKKYSRISPSRALIISAIGSERVEALCDTFCRELGEEYAKKGALLSPRFSAGYGDLSLGLQKYIFETLGLTRHLGVTLNDSLLMTPAKSVTAIMAIRPKKDKEQL